MCLTIFRNYAETVYCHNISTENYVNAVLTSNQFQAIVFLTVTVPLNYGINIIDVLVVFSFLFTQETHTKLEVKLKKNCIPSSKYKD